MTTRVKWQGRGAKAVLDQIYTWETQTGLDLDGDGQVGLFCMRSPWRQGACRQLRRAPDVSAPWRLHFRSGLAETKKAIWSMRRHIHAAPSI